MNVRVLIAAAAAALVAGPALACYTVYDANNRVVYNAQVPPVDMRLPLHQALAERFPGGHLVFDTASACPRDDRPVASVQPAPAGSRSPLLTDADTARSLGLPHTVTAGGVAVVRERPDAMRPGVMVAESGRLPRASDTTMMGGPGALRDPTTMMGGAPARGLVAPGGTPPAGWQSPVITEMHNPPLTAVQPGGYRR